MIYVRDTIRKLPVALTRDNPALIILNALQSRPASFWAGLSADDVTVVCMTCHEAGVAIPERGTDAFGSAVAGDVGALT
jgi:hypothetical protein